MFSSRGIADYLNDIKSAIAENRGYHASHLPSHVVIPDIGEVRAFAGYIHTIGRHWQGEIFGWQAEYTPEKSKKPIGSKMIFSPADFCIGESGIWFYSLMWEKGKGSEPTEFLDSRGIIST